MLSDTQGVYRSCVCVCVPLTAGRALRPGLRAAAAAVCGQALHVSRGVVVLQAEQRHWRLLQTVALLPVPLAHLADKVQL